MSMDDIQNGFPSIGTRIMGMNEQDKKLCDERHNYLHSELKRHQGWMGDMQNDIKSMQEERGSAKEAMKNTNNSLKRIEKIQYWIMTLIVGTAAINFFGNSATKAKVMALVHTIFKGMGA